MKLTKYGFKSWLDSLDPKSRPATCGEPARCILAKYIAATTDKPGLVYVDGETYQDGLTKDQLGESGFPVVEGKTLPAWAGDVIEKFDELSYVGGDYTKHRSKYRPSIKRVREAIGI